VLLRVAHDPGFDEANTMRLFDHLDMRVRDMREAEGFYDLVLPALGFPTKGRTPHCVYYEALTAHPKPEFVALIEEPAYIASSTRIAFWCDTREALDSVSAILVTARARNLEGPMFCPEYSPTYYAVFFEDPSGNRLEVACRVAQ
jgi:catechol 2,3-dioxygenase-like lactoylglutathione lyase family enzyme